MTTFEIVNSPCPDVIFGSDSFIANIEVDSSDNKDHVVMKYDIYAADSNRKGYIEFLVDEVMSRKENLFVVRMRPLRVEVTTLSEYFPGPLIEVGIPGRKMIHSDKS